MVQSIERLESRSLFSGGFGAFLGNISAIWNDATVKADLEQIKTDTQALRTAIQPLLQQANDLRTAAQPELTADFQSLVAAWRTHDSAAVTTARTELQTDLETLQTQLKPIYESIRTTSEPFEQTLRDDRTKLFNDIKAVTQSTGGTTTISASRKSLFSGLFS